MTTAPANDLQKAVYQILIADADVSALVGARVFDTVPGDGHTTPYITFGPSDEIGMEMNGIEAAEHSLQIDVWSEKKGGFKECKAITFAVKKALQRKAVDLETHGLAELWIEQRRHMRDQDQITSHGIVIVQALIEER